MEDIPKPDDFSMEHNEDEATEAKVDISSSYIELDGTRPLKHVPAPTPVVLTTEQVFRFTFVVVFFGSE